MKNSRSKNHKIAIDGFNYKLHITEERINKLEDESKNIQTEVQKNKRQKVKKKGIGDREYKRFNKIIKIPEGQERVVQKQCLKRNG